MSKSAGKNCCMRPRQIVWSATVPPVRNLRPGYAVIYPNRDKAASKVDQAIVVMILLVSVVLMLIVTVRRLEQAAGAEAGQLRLVHRST